MELLTLLIQLFCTFFIIGIFTFGGGYAMLSLIQTQVVTAHAWISESSFTNIVAISQMTPGPIGINSATYVGYEVLNEATGSHLWGILGSFTATTAIVLPSFLIVLTIVHFYNKYKQSTVFEGVMSWIRPAVSGLIGAAAIILICRTTWTGTPFFSMPEISVIRENFIDWKSWLLFGLAIIASLWLKVGPIAIIIIGGLAGLLLY